MAQQKDWLPSGRQDQLTIENEGKKGPWGPLVNALIP
jgi:hypothetical protein